MNTPATSDQILHFLLFPRFLTYTRIRRHNNYKDNR